MYRHVLIATDGSQLAMRGVEAGCALAAATDAQVTVLGICEPLASVGDHAHAFAREPEDWRKAADDYLEGQTHEAVKAACACAARLGLEARSRVEESSHVAEAIVEAADAVGADLIVMGSHGRRGLSAVLLGSVAQRVLTHGQRPVLIVR